MDRYLSLSFLFCLLAFAGCKNQHKSVSIKDSLPNPQKTPCDTTSIYKSDKDTIFLNEKKEQDPFWITRSELKNLLKTYPELACTTIILNPDEAWARSDTRDAVNPCHPNRFNCEVCRDDFFMIYAYLLKQRNGEQKYQGCRDTLIKLFRDVNSIFGELLSGGTYFGHQYRRILGYAEYGVYLRKESSSEMNYDISKQRKLYIMWLRQYITDYVNADQELMPKEKNHKRKNIMKTVDEIDGLISKLFYLQETQNFQYSNYQY